MKVTCRRARTGAALVLGLLLACACDDGGLYQKDFKRIAAGGIDDRLNSYPWAMELFDGDRDGTPEVYIGSLGNALCIQTPGMFWLDYVLPGYTFMPPERWQCPNELWDPTDWTAFLSAAFSPAYVFRGTYEPAGGTLLWERVWAPDLETDVLGFRGARVFEDALYVCSNHGGGPAVWKSVDGQVFERASPPDMGIFGGPMPPGFRGAQVFKDRLCVASDQAAAIFCSSDPSTDPASWQAGNSTGFVDSGGGVREIVYWTGTVTGATANTLNDETGTWLSNMHQGRRIRITAGTGAGQDRLIASNSLNSLTVTTDWTPLPDPTSAYEIHDPAAMVNGPIWQMAVFDEHLYAITFSLTGDGPELWKTDDPAPGNWTRVIQGGYGNTGNGFMSVRPFGDHLYIGTAVYPPLFAAGMEVQGCEILRVDAADNVELVVGKPRPEGAVGPDEVWPISGIRQGFGQLSNLYVWYMAEYDGWFYAATCDFNGMVLDSLAESVPGLIDLAGLFLGPTGFDLWRTQDGVRWVKVTDTGFGGRDNYGVRNLKVTPWGFLLGTANAVDGFELWLGRKE